MKQKTLQDPESFADGSSLAARPTIVCLDDDSDVLEGLRLHLQRRYIVAAVTSGVQALALLSRIEDVAVVLSDLRMPSMDGLAFLRQARRVVPSASRILLTGAPDLQSAVAAVNEGEIYRFLTKPCPPSQLLEAVGDGVRKHRTDRDVRASTTETLRGAISMLADLLLLADPAAYDRAIRVKSLASEIAKRLGVEEAWPLEAAAILSQVGMLAVGQRPTGGRDGTDSLTPAEVAAAELAPLVGGRLASRIPGLEAARGIVARLGRRFREPGVIGSSTIRSHYEEGAQILRVVLAYEAACATAGFVPTVVLGGLRSRPDDYEPRVVETLAVLLGTARADIALPTL